MTDRPITICVLGPVRVDAASGPVPLTRLQRRLVAELAVEFGRAVSVDKLAEELWGEEQPRSARSRVQALVSSVRRRAGETTILTAPPGYRLNPAAVSCDADLFVREVNGARRASATDKATAFALLSSALDRWSGPAYNGEHSVQVENAARYLEELRLSARETWLDLAPQVGHDAGAVAEATALVAAHPLRERSRALLMLALARVGRVADALATYRDGNQLLRSELGIEPGADLQRAHRTVLGAERVHADGAASIAVNQLPRGLATFVGREDELNRIQTALAVSPDDDRTSGGPVVILNGFGGVGKTALAVHAARSVLEHFPDGCLFADLRGAEPPGAPSQTVLAAFLRALGVNSASLPYEPDERVGLFRSLVRHRRILLVLDNAWDEAQLRPLLPNGRGSAAIVTARSSLPGLAVATRVPVGPLDRGASATLLASIVGADRLAGDPASVVDLLDLCNGLPLALRVVAARLTVRPGLTPGDVARALARSETRVAQLSAGNLAVQSALAHSYQRIGTRTASLFRRIGQLGRPETSREACGVLLEGSSTDVDAALRELQDTSLLTCAAGAGAACRVYRTHDLLLAFAGAIEPEPEDELARRRLAEFYLSSVAAARARLVPAPFPEPLAIGPGSAEPTFPTQQEALAWLDEKVDAIADMIVHAHASGWDRQAWQLALCLFPYLRNRRRMDEWLTTSRLGLVSAERLGDPAAQGYLRESIGSVELERGEHAAALRTFRAALTLFVRAGRPLYEARCNEQISVALQQIGDLEGAERHLRQALATPEYALDPRQSAYGRNHLGTLYGRLHRYAEAAVEFELALPAAEAAADRYLVTFLLHNLGYLNHILQRTAAAREYAEREILVASEAQLPLRQARGWELLGDILLEAEPSSALAAYDRALRLYDDLGDDRGRELRDRLTTVEVRPR